MPPRTSSARRLCGVQPAHTPATYSPSRLHILLIRSFAVASATVAVSAAAAGSFGSVPRYGAYDYDLTTPIYTPDGRLLQVEYACEAPCRSGFPIVAVGVTMPPRAGCGGRQSGSVLVMATVSSPAGSTGSSSASPPDEHGSQSRDDDSDENIGDDGFVGGRRTRRVQSRIVHLPLGRSPLSPSDGRTTTLLMGMSGVLSDASALLREVRSELENEQRSYGWHRLHHLPPASPPSPLYLSSLPSLPAATNPSETAIRAARAAADRCQSHAFGGGIRPFGASLLVAGMDEEDATGRGGGRMTLCETDPSGACTVLVCDENRLGRTGARKEDAPPPSPVVTVSGGPRRLRLDLRHAVEGNVRRTLRRLIEERDTKEGRKDDGNDEDDEAGNCVEEETRVAETRDEAFVREILRTVIATMAEEWHRSETGGVVFPPIGATSSPPLPRMEVSFVASQGGAYELSDGEIVRLMQKYGVDRKTDFDDEDESGGPARRHPQGNYSP